jgi:hypothetical protein
MEKEYSAPFTNPETDAGEVTFTDVPHNGIEEQFCGVTPVPLA